MPVTLDSPREARARRVGRRVGWITFTVIVAGFTVVNAIYVIRQAFAPESGAAPAECRAGVQALIAAVDRARLAAAEATGGEDDALRQFRLALEPEWKGRQALGVLCRDYPTAQRALSEIHLLRFAEEAVVRYQVMDLAKRRQQVRELDARLTAERQAAR